MVGVAHLGRPDHARSGTVTRSGWVHSGKGTGADCSEGTYAWIAGTGTEGWFTAADRADGGAPALG
ncbi:hypothetical protein ACW4TU_19085 [Streptomyces sp. QTS52]